MPSKRDSDRSRPRRSFASSVSCGRFSRCARRGGGSPSRVVRLSACSIRQGPRVRASISTSWRPDFHGRRREPRRRSGRAPRVGRSTWVRQHRGHNRHGGRLHDRRPVPKRTRRIGPGQDRPRPPPSSDSTPTARLPGPRLFRADDLRFPVVREAELLGQKLGAVAYRAHPRDLYDIHLMLGLGWHRRARARAMYLAYSFLQDSEWFRLDYPVRLAVDYRPGLLADVLREAERAPSLDQIRNEARQALAERRLPFTKASVTEPALRRKLLKGARTAFARIVGEGVPSRRRQLSRHPGLAWRLQRTAPRSSAAEQLPEGPWVTPSPSPGPTPPVVPGGIPARPVRSS
jgi:hypothetical protein